MKKWEDEDTRSIVSFAAALLPGILTVTIKNGMVQMVFLCMALLWLIIFYKGGKNKIWLGSLGICMVVILAVSVTNNDADTGFLEQITDFFKPIQVEEEKKEDPVLLTARDKYDMVEQQSSEKEQRYTELFGRLEEASSNISALKQDTYISSEGREDSQEIEQILAYINSKEELIATSFSGLKTSKDDVERFYKMQLTDEGYYYCNVIAALEEYGIDCKALHVDKFDLAHWDTEIIYIFYRIKRSIEQELAENTFYGERSFRYGDFSVKDVEKFQDIFDYQRWIYTFNNNTVQEMDDLIDNYILKYYDSFHRNFDKSGE